MSKFIERQLCGVSRSGPDLEAIPVAQYLRMSTEHQRYSIVNQRRAIARYADQHGMTVVRTYADEGKSGLDAEGRGSFLRMISDVVNKEADYRAVLVLDVSRWGRFQNTDASAHYEYLCAHAGVRVVYCAEPFENDGTPMAALLKNLKRSMDGEYSRELSAKVFAGQCALARLGYFQGGTPGYGLQRRLIASDGTPKGVLAPGERKSIHCDRVVLAAGPPEEVRRVRTIFSAYVERGLTETQIAEQLNRQGVRTDRDRPWTRRSVHGVLTNERYLGSTLYNRRSGKLKSPMQWNPPAQWIRLEQQFKPMVKRKMFDRAQALLRLRAHKDPMDDSQMLALLRRLARRRRVSVRVIDAQRDMPCATSYRQRFGSLAQAYELAGIALDRDFAYVERSRFLRRVEVDMAAAIAARLAQEGIRTVHEASSSLVIVGRSLVKARIVQCSNKPRGAKQWRIPGAAPNVDVLAVIRMDEANRAPMDYFCIPNEQLGRPPLLMAKYGGRSIAGCRCASFEALLSRCRSIGLGT
jgi:DNA invertase Pin-like site-specific DNA recombinase